MPANLSVVVIGRPPLTCISLGQILESRGLDVLQPDDLPADGASVALLIDPSYAEWTDVRERGMPIVLVTQTTVEPAAAATAMIFGADALFDGTSEPEAILAAVRGVARGEVYLTAPQAKAVVETARRLFVATRRLVRLSDRELDILKAFVRGLRTKEVAALFGVSTKTVENTQSRLYRKLGCHTRAEAIARAYALSIIAPGSAERAVDGRPLTDVFIQSMLSGGSLVADAP